MKGSNKQFARYLHSEYNDDYLDAPDDLIDEYGLKKSSKPASQQQPHAFKNTKQPQHPNKKAIESPKPSPKFSYVKLSISRVQDLAKNLSEDVQTCVKNLRTVEYVQDPEVLETFKEFYTKFQTIPVLFCSIVPNEAVYVWQVNKLCPFKREMSSLVIDSRSLESDMFEQISFLMLAKIKQEKDEEIVDVKFLSDTQLMVKSRLMETQLVIRQYNIKDFYGIAIVNPYRQKVIANKLYSYKLLINGVTKVEDNITDLEGTLWETKTTEQLNAEFEANPYAETQRDALIGRQICKEFPFPFKAHALDFSDYYRAIDDINIVIDQDSATVIAWKDTEFAVSRFDVGVIRSIKQYDGALFVVNGQNVEYKIDFYEFPDLKISQESILLSNERSPNDVLRTAIMTWFVHQKQLENLEFMELKYDSSIKLVNTQMPRDRINDLNYNHQEASCPEKSIAQKVAQKKREIKQLNNKGTIIEEQKAMLKDIRADISHSMGEVHEFNEKSKRLRLYQVTGEEEPKGVSRDTLNLYEEIKIEKKRAIEERNREKTNKKNGRTDKFEI